MTVGMKGDFELPNRALGAFAVLSLILGAGYPGDGPDDVQIRSADLEAQLRFLASDELAGRLTGTPGNDTAARFIAEQLRASGVTPPAGWDDYLQSVPLLKISPPERQRVVLDGRNLESGKDFIFVSGPPLEYEGEALAAGYGVADDSRNDYRGFVAGKTALVQFGLPGAPELSPGTIRAKRETAQAKGAAAILEFYSGRDWDRLVGYLGSARFQLDTGAPEGDQGIPYILIRESEANHFSPDQSPVEIALAIGSRGRESLRSSNVVGVIAGKDPRLRSQYLVLSAHYDHVGSGIDIHGATERDHIFNGARDNGMGVVALLTAARLMGRNPPSRSVILLALAAEEQGLLGSSYYVEHPVVALQQTIFDLNSDGAGFTDTGVVTVLGLARSSAQASIAAGSQAVGLEAIEGPRETESFYDRSDNVNFARKGVPAVTFSPGFRKLDQALMSRYHEPSDEVDPDFDFEYLRRFCLAFATAGERIANAPEAPAWTPGDRYEAAGKALYGSQR